MRKEMRCRGFIVGLLSLGMLAEVAMTPSRTQAEMIALGPYYAMPSWDQTLPASTRFIVLSNFASVAVLDRTTGLVWLRSPSLTKTTWATARFNCANASVGGEYGWRLPSLPELASLQNLPADHPFNFVQVDLIGYWSATSVADAPDEAWSVIFIQGTNPVQIQPKSANKSVWCVRGPMNADAY